MEATERGALNLEPDAWRQSGKHVPVRGKPGNVMSNHKIGAEESPFPAQVRFSVVHRFPPLPEKAFAHVVKYQGSTHNFDFTLDADQVAMLMECFLALEQR